MRWRTFEILEQVGLTAYERKALIALMIQGLADAATLCREGEVPSSKIYRAMEKLRQLGLVEIQTTRPKLYAALPGDELVRRLVEISRRNADQFARSAEELATTLAGLPEGVRGHRTSVDLALGVESHVKRHVMHLVVAQKRIWSYLEQGDLASINQVTASGFPILRRIARNAADRKIDQRVVFGFGYKTAPMLVAFLHQHRAHLEHVTGVRSSGELGHPFHVIDDDTVILSLDHPFIPEGRFASLLVRDRELAQRLAEGFQELWAKAMRDLREIDFHPRAAKGVLPDSVEGA
ncbi:MAG TPA: helix-turn-helix domain-containing protein [Blastocatellia bacterium]|nr:helix-turn-helix domain-containing protein [Blastocatellia bacterium]